MNSIIEAMSPEKVAEMVAMKEKAQRRKELCEQDPELVAKKWARHIAEEFTKFADHQSDDFRAYFVLDERMHSKENQDAAAIHQLTHEHFMQEINLTHSEVFEGEDDKQVLLIIDDTALCSEVQRYHGEDGQIGDAFAVQYWAERAEA